MSGAKGGAAPRAAVQLDDVADALALGTRSLVSLVGGGGKTTLLFELGRQLGGRVLLSTTTRMGTERTGGYPLVVGESTEPIAQALDEAAAVLAWRATDHRKALGFAPETVDRWFASGVAEHIVVEADGARRRPFTAPAPWEPPIPASSTHVVACIGSDALGYVIADRLHRPLRVAAAAGCSPYQRLTPPRAAAALSSPIGMMKNVPAAARFTVAVTRADPAHAQAVELAEELAERGVPALLVADRGHTEAPNPR